uniref:Uncharacterized protein n=1 Tax=Otus sunia TaxID=257818 RepID=A0A8C8B0N5_9STRI
AASSLLPASRRRELYRAPGAGGEAPPRRWPRKGGPSAPLGTGHRGAASPMGPQRHPPPRLGPPCSPRLGGHRWHGGSGLREPRSGHPAGEERRGRSGAAPQSRVPGGHPPAPPSLPAPRLGAVPGPPHGCPRG